MNRNRAARTIQRKWRTGSEPFIINRALLFDKKNLQKYPKHVARDITKYTYEHGLRVVPHPYMANKIMVESTNIRGENISNFYKFIKERLPESLLPKLTRLNWNKIEMLEKKKKKITNAFFPVRKIIKILKKHPSLRYAARIMENLNLYAAQFSNQIKEANANINTIKNIIGRHIGVCHINTTLRNNPSVSKFTYLLYYRNQMKLACEQIVKSRISEKEFVTRFKSVLGNRPCMENLIDAISQVAFGEVQWKGVNRVINLRRNKNALRNEIIAPYMKIHLNSIRKNGNKSNYTKNRLWNSIKNRPLYVLTNNGPGYVTLKNANVRMVSNNAFNKYAQYLE